jgi:hypothetical protein
MNQKWLNRLSGRMPWAPTKAIAFLYPIISSHTINRLLGNDPGN